MNREARILVVSSGPPVDAGGGSRRTGQLLHELRARFGAPAVELLARAEFASRPSDAAGLLGWKARRAATVIDDRLANPYQWFARGYGFSARTDAFEGAYRRRLDALPGLRVCVVEHLEFAPLHAVHGARGLRTILAPWFLGSLTLQMPYLFPAVRRLRAGAGGVADRVQLRSAGVHLANELAAFARAERAWMPSRVEAGFLASCGLPAGYLPYYPAGEALRRLRAIRARREGGEIDAGLFLLTGSGIDHNRLSALEFLRAAALPGFPAGARIEVIGADFSPDERAAIGTREPRVLFRGRVPEEEFEGLAARARAVLVPQACGFGVSTRVIDMAVAGVPVIADGMVELAAGAVPGAVYAPPGPAGWREAAEAAMAAPPVVPAEPVESWLADARRAFVREFGATLPALA